MDKFLCTYASLFLLSDVGFNNTSQYVHTSGKCYQDLFTVKHSDNHLFHMKHILSYLHNAFDCRCFVIDTFILTQFCVIVNTFFQKSVDFFEIVCYYSYINDERTGYMANLGDRIKQLRKKHGYTQSEFIQILKDKYNLKADRVMLSKWECSKQCPHIETLKCIASAFDVSLDYLNGIEEKPNLKLRNVSPAVEVQMPMYGKIACGSPIECNVDFDIETIHGDHVDGDFCVIARGDSMINARIFDGDIITVRRQSVVENGEIAAVAIGDEATLKRVYYIENGVMLVPENPAYKPMVFVGEDCANVVILGKAVSMHTVLN